MSSNTPQNNDDFQPPRWAQMLKFALSVVAPIITVATGMIELAKLW